MDAQPIDWFVRVVFSELLDPDIERLERIEGDDGEVTFEGHLDQSQPVQLTCGGVDVAYDGFYDPSGNDVTFPPGPALVIQPLDFVATGTSDCTVTIKNIVRDKDGNSVSDPILIGPHDFGIAVMTPAGTDPADQSTGVDPTFGFDPEDGSPTGPAIQFNAPVAPASLAGQITMVDENGAPVAFTADAIGPIVQLSLPAGTALASNTTFTVTVPATNTITDIAGGELQLGADDFTFKFTTGTPSSN
jgi:hypothetical protein